MKEISVKNKDTLIQVINNILTSGSRELRLKIEANSILFNNLLNLKILAKITKQSGIVLKLETSSARGSEMISKLWKSQKEEEYSPLIEEEPVKERVIEKKKFEMNLPKLNFNLKENTFLPIALGVIAVFFIGGYFFINSRLSANVDIKVGAERFVKSFEVKLSTLTNTDIEKKTLRVESLSRTYTATKEIETTGKTDTGVKSDGEVKFQNKTDSDIVLKAGTKLTLDDPKEELVYELSETVTVPKRTLVSSAPEKYTFGEEVGKAKASNTGSNYNISSGKTLIVSGHKSTELVATVSSSFEGGIKKTTASVDDKDLTNLSAASLDEFKSNFKIESSDSKVILKNSQVFSVTKETFDGKLTEPKDKLKVTQEITVTSLAYDQNEALSFVKASIKSLIPDGFELYGKDLQVEFNILGNTDKTVLNSREADAQLTVRSYKIPVFDEKKIKNDLAGKSLDEVQSYLTKLDNVINYDIELNYNIPFVKNLPKDVSKINVTITRQ